MNEEMALRVIDAISEGTGTCLAVFESIGGDEETLKSICEASSCNNIPTRAAFLLGVVAGVKAAEQ